ncbi:tRNA 4-thiouridine(8) synthase ThiI [Geothermobacter hydrogeniphilus]|uniref:Probable tRNA sulfurtransferase n=1 Tax=Geothermobacter hydrogeniphilus TaxID=1969733 RepID=A0A2K2H6B8_9BACT|nr:tRNA uracil 4-sulfurtransferase ThiI [Geothermobacter hydrogeniphilus]PNU18787.1 tRNA 4-thiouridine(8) synthase ThiI [Geothermobacter hydrogeniphilus]
MFDRIIIHYSEIGIKGKNRSFFENQLVRRIKQALGEQARVHKRYGRIVCVPEPDADAARISDALRRVPGIAHFSMGCAAEKDLEAIREKAVGMLSEMDFTSFGVKSRRSDKSFPVNSNEINRQVGSSIVLGLDKKVNLTDPDLWLHIELTHDEALLYSTKISGPGGLPVGTSGKAVVSLSGGIDSPVAAWMMMKRGCELVFGHIRNETQFAGGAVGKIENLVATLSRSQRRSKLYIFPFGDIQRHIIAFVPAKERMIIYRRCMMRLLNMLAEKEKAGAIVTGDSLGQVASQTMDNMLCIQAASRRPVLAPLVGLNKEEIIAIAERVGTFEDSIQPYPDCCSFMIAPHPDTRARLPDIERFEAAMPQLDELLQACLDEAELRIIDTEKPGEAKSGTKT